MLEEENSAREAEIRFNSRMEALNEIYDLDEDDSKIVASEISDLDESEESFAEYQEKPHPLAGLAFDAISAIGALAQAGNSNALTTKALTRKSGFTGVDGIFRFTSSGTNQRGLAIAQINESQVNIIDDAPQSFNYSGM